MRYFRPLVLLGVCTLFSHLASRAPAAEPYLEFLHALQDQGYGEMAVEYLQRIEKEKALPAEVREVFDLEMCNSLRVAAKEAYSEKDAEPLMARALTYLEKFLKEHPDHPAIADALHSFGDLAFDEAQKKLNQANAAEDKAEADKLRAEARAKFAEARPRYTEALAKSKARLAALPKPDPKAAAKREEKKLLAERLDVEIGILESRFKLALLDYYSAQTYAAADAARKPALLAAAKEFDAIYQERKLYEVGMSAHAWEGRVREDLGEAQTAKDIYEEVLANMPARGLASDRAPLFCEVQIFWMRLVAGSDPASVVVDGRRFLTDYEGWKRLPGYQGVALETAKAEMATAQKLEGAVKEKMLSSARQHLADVAKSDSYFKQQAILLRRELSKQPGGGGTNADENIALGQLAMEEKRFDEAAKLYETAVAMAAKEKPKNPKTIESAQTGLGEARYWMAVRLYSEGKHEEAIKAAEAVAQDKLMEKIAPTASALTVSSAMAMYIAATTPEAKKAALARLKEYADFTIKKWPVSEGADDARISLGQVLIVEKDVAGGMAALAGVDVRSARKPFALHLAAQTNWREYIREMQKAAAERDEKLLAKHKAAAEDFATRSVDLQTKNLDKTQPLSEQLLESQLLLGEISLESKKDKEALALLAPLIEEFQKNKPATITPTILRTFIAGTKAYVAAGDIDKAGEVALLLVEVGGDNPKINQVLVDFAKILREKELQPAQAAVIQATAENQAAAQTRLDGAKKLMETLLGKLAGQQEMSIGGMVFVANTSVEIGSPASVKQAQELYDKIIEKATQNPDLVPPQALAGVRAKLVGLLRAKGDYENAYAQAEKLIESNPRSLEPLMEKGHTLQAWAAQDPSKYAEAVEHWSRVRLLLSKAGGSAQLRNTMYEVVYNVAFCLLGQAKATNDPQHALTARQLLKSVMITNPKLAADLAAKYQTLLEELQQFAPPASS